MHCDDKRTLYVLKQEIEKNWNKLKDSDFDNMKLLNEIYNDISEYLEYKKQAN